MTDLRKVQRKAGEGWVDVRLGDIVAGDTFRMFEPDDGSPVIGLGGETEFLATRDAYLDPTTSVCTVDCA